MKRLLIALSIVALLGVGCGKKDTTAPPTEIDNTGTEAAATEPEEPVRDLDQPLSYKLNGIAAISERSLLLVRNIFTAEMLTSMSQECGTNLSQEHFDELLEQFRHQRGHRYNILHRQPTKEPNNYSLVVISNDPGYETLEDFKNDFDVCAAGSTLIPLDLNDLWLVFESGCGTSEDSDCDEIRTQVKETLEIN